LYNNPEDAYSKLNGLISSPNRTERERRKYLHFASTLLFREDVLRKIVYVEPEVITSSGISDYVISGYIGNNPLTSDLIKTYVWELKAPQCFLFEKDNENRLRPTFDLVDAENQLLYYYDDLKGNETLKNRFRVSHSDNVCIGGIIIGSWQNVVNGQYDEGKKAILYQSALKIREKYFYGRVIRLLTWNDVLENIGGGYKGIVKMNSNQSYVFQTPITPKDTLSIYESVKSPKD
jgi:hypothetical protein